MLISTSHTPGQGMPHPVVMTQKWLSFDSKSLREARIRFFEFNFQLNITWQKSWFQKMLISTRHTPGQGMPHPVVMVQKWLSFDPKAPWEARIRFLEFNFQLKITWPESTSQKMLISTRHTPGQGMPHPVVITQKWLSFDPKTLWEARMRFFEFNF